LSFRSEWRGEGRCCGDAQEAPAVHISRHGEVGEALSKGRHAVEDSDFGRNFSRAAVLHAVVFTMERAEIEAFLRELPQRGLLDELLDEDGVPTGIRTPVTAVKRGSLSERAPLRRGFSFRPRSGLALALGFIPKLHRDAREFHTVGARKPASPESILRSGDVGFLVASLRSAPE
jgi:hypothetical protein